MRSQIRRYISASVLMTIVSTAGFLTNCRYRNEKVGRGWLACGTVEPTKDELREQREFVRRRRDLVDPLPHPVCSIEVRVVFHIIRDKAGSATDLSWSHMYGQLDVLNRAFSSTPFHFVLSSAEWHDEPNLVKMDRGSQSELDAKARFHRGNAAVLNIYTADPQNATDGDTSSRLCNDKTDFCGPAGGPAVDVGWATFPWDYTKHPELDGVVLAYKSLPNVPNGKHDAHNNGKIGVHEVGHWLGLIHTFDGGCDDRDEVSDTPAELAPVEFEGIERAQEYCANGRRDTCKDKPGNDPVHNYMTYSTEECMDSFTPEQVRRMDEQAFLYRGLSLSMISSVFGAYYGQFDSDGKVDRLYRNMQKHTSLIWYADGTKSDMGDWCSHDGSELFVGDFNGDRRDDLLCRDGSQMWIRHSDQYGRFVAKSPFEIFPEWNTTTNWCSHTGAKVYIGHFNADRRDDLLCHDNGGFTWIRYADNQGVFDFTHGSEWFDTANWCRHNGARLYIGNFNRDSHDDLLCHDSSGASWIRLSNPNGHFISGNDWSSNQNWCYHCGAQLNLGDFNGDGRDDMLCHDGTGFVWILYANPLTGYFSGSTEWSQQLDYCHHSGSSLSVGDANGDGFADLLCDDWQEQHWEKLSPF